MDSSANSSSNSTVAFLHLCLSSDVGHAMFTAWFVVRLLLFPLFLFVLFIGITKWWKECNGNSTAVSISHSDVFTFHMMAIEILGSFGGTMFMYGFHTSKDLIADIGSAMFTLCMNGQTYFHCVTCGERYLAVVHPITYLRLKKRGGVTIRNICIVFAWLLSFIYTTAGKVMPDVLALLIKNLLLVLVVVVPVTFCSISALCILIRPGPGEGDRKRKRIDQSKRSAFTTITAILGVLLVRMVQLFVINCWFVLVGVDSCVLSITTFWLSLPSSLVLPLLFLHRAGKLPTCC